MSKKYKGKTCVYCGEPKSSGDGEHVFSRKFFLEIHRGDLPKVPSCKECNGEKSKLEHYMLHALPFGARHVDGGEHRDVLLPSRRRNNLKLDRSLRASRRGAFETNASGLAVPSGAFLVDAKVFVSWLEFVSRGLSWHHWKMTIPTDWKIDTGAATKLGVAQLLDFMRTIESSQNFANVSLGDGTISYIGGHNGGVVVWLVQLFGGVVLGGGDDRLVSTTLYSVARSAELSESLQREARWRGSLIIRP